MKGLRRIAGLGAALLMLLGAVGTSGCAAFRIRTRDTDLDEGRHLGSRYDFRDMRAISEAVAEEMAGSAFLARAAEPPVMMIAGVQNRTSRYVDTKNLTDRMRTLLFQTERVRFVNEARREDLMREQGYQAQHVTPEQQVQIGRQLGAQYMITGSLTEMEDQTGRQVRVSRTRVNYYKLTVEVTDLQSGEIAWINEQEFAREARLPLIGW